MSDEYDVIMVVKCDSLETAEALAQSLKHDLVKKPVPLPVQVFIRSPRPAANRRITRRAVDQRADCDCALCEHARARAN